jgi:hypothetical protein
VITACDRAILTKEFTLGSREDRTAGIPAA